MKKPNAIQTAASAAACKLTRFALRRTGRGGTAVPGIVAMKISKNILAAVSEGMEIVVVTGTNGKTTTCNMIEHALTAAGYDCLLNKSGANMLHGIASDLISNTDWRGKPKSRYAVLECDEAALKLLVPYIHPKVIVVTNLFSDQVDRYGGVENTLKEIRKGVERSPHSVLVLNAEDPLSASLSLGTPNKTVWYGMNPSVGPQGSVDLADAGSCPRCGGAYEYSFHTYAHLGGFRCPKCGWQRPEPAVCVTSIDQKDTDGSTVHLRAGDQTLEARIALPAVYNIYNAAASIAAASAMGVPAKTAAEALSSVRSSFGRMETFDLDGRKAQMILVKNPAGSNQAFYYITAVREDYAAVLCLNNRTGDGHDYSWIENTDYEKLCADPHLKKLYVGGDCAQDLYDRLLRAGASEENMEIVTDYSALLQKLRAGDLPVFFLPNYTAMMDIRPLLQETSGAKAFWE